MQKTTFAVESFKCTVDYEIIRKTVEYTIININKIKITFKKKG